MVNRDRYTMRSIRQFMLTHQEDGVLFIKIGLYTYYCAHRLNILTHLARLSRLPKEGRAFVRIQ